MIGENDLDFEFIPIEGRADMPRLGVRLIHIPSGIIVEYNKSISRMKNYEECMRRMYKELYKNKM